MIMTPYDFQTQTKNKVNVALEHGNTLLIAPTGAGKTFMGSMVAQEHIAKGGRVLWLVNLVALLSQTYTETSMFSEVNSFLLHGTCRRDIDGNSVRNIIKTKDEAYINVPEAIGNLMITSAISFNNFHAINMVMDFEPTLIVIDEAHKGTSEEWQKVRNLFPNVPILGLTATPSRAQSKDDQERLRNWYSQTVTASTIRDLIELGQLVQPEYIDHYDIDRDNVVDVWLEVTKGEENRRTIVFAKSKDHAKKVTDAFINRGITAERVISEDAGEESNTINEKLARFQRFRNGETEVLVSVYALCEGFDEKLARYCFLLRNVGGEDAVSPVNRALFQQMVGRILRAYRANPALKPNGVVVDFCTNVQRFGPVEDWDWDLDQEEEQTRIGHTKQLSSDGELLLGDVQKRTHLYHTCEHCGHVFNIKKFERCPARNCGTEHGQSIVFTVKWAKYILARYNGQTGWRGWEEIPAGSNDLERLQSVIRTVEKRMMAQDGLGFNEKFGVPVFVEPSVISDEFKWIERILQDYRGGFDIKFMPDRKIMSKLSDGVKFDLV